METFGDWLLEELDERGWSQSELARRAHLGNATLSRIISGLRRAGPDAALAIARALGEPPEEVFRRAGLLPPLPGPGDELALKELLEIVRQLSPEDREDVLEYALFRYRRRQAQRGRVANGQNAAATVSAAARGVKR